MSLHDLMDAANAAGCGPPPGARVFADALVAADEATTRTPDEHLCGGVTGYGCGKPVPPGPGRGPDDTWWHTECRGERRAAVAATARRRADGAPERAARRLATRQLIEQHRGEFDELLAAALTAGSAP